MSFWGSFSTLLGLGVLYLLVLFSLRFCATHFARRTPTWRLPESGHVAGLVTANVGAVRDALVDAAGQEVHWVSGSGPGRKRIRLNRKNSSTPCGVTRVQSRPRVWKRLRHLGHSSFSHS